MIPYLNRSKFKNSKITRPQLKELAKGLTKSFRKFDKIEKKRTPKDQDNSKVGELKDNFKVAKQLQKYQYQFDNKLVQEDKDHHYAKWLDRFDVWDEPDRSNPYAAFGVG